MLFTSVPLPTHVKALMTSSPNEHTRLALQLKHESSTNIPADNYSFDTFLMTTTVDGEMNEKVKSSTTGNFYDSAVESGFRNELIE